ncbi:MAG: YfhO family protein [Patescibacteria group bacterium]
MVKIQKLVTRHSLLFLCLVVVIFFLPVLIRPDLITKRDNDLGRTYVPIYSFIAKSFHENKNLPLWRPSQMGGENFVGNPLSSIFYPPNVIFLLLPVDTGVIMYYLFHLLISVVSTYYLAKSFNLSKSSSLAAAIVYTFSTKIILHITAGHITMVAAFTLFPLLFLTVRNIILGKSGNQWTLLGALAVYGMLATYPTIFYYALIFLLFYIVYKFNFFIGKYKDIIKSITPFALTLILGILLSAIFLLPQLEFAKYSTRGSLTLTDVAQPIWNAKKFVLSLFFPYPIFNSLSHEEFLYLGFSPLLLGTYAFFKLSRGKKLILFMFSVLTLIFIAGTSTPIFELFYKYVPGLSYSRITTRPWFIVALVAALLLAYGLDSLKNKNLAYLFVLIFLVETVFIGYKKVTSVPYLKANNEDMYQYLAADKDIFRVYCTTYCFNPQLLNKYDIQTLNGETPLQEKAAVDYMQKAGNYTFNQFAVIFPPYQVWQIKNPPQPYANLLATANVKYVASTYLLTSDELKLVNKFDNIYLYENTLVNPRYYFQDDPSNVNIKNYSPNSILLTFSKADSPRKLNISEFYYPGWFAYMNNKKYQVEKDTSGFMYVNVAQQTDALELKFEPNPFFVGKAVTLTTLLLLLGYFWYKQKNKDHD